MAFTVTSPAFAGGQSVPEQFTCDGNDAPPPLTVSDPPDGTRSFAVIMDDPDAPKGTFTHWLAYDIPVDNSELRVTAGKTLRNSFGREGYGGPCPPPGHGAHRYFFKVYALDVPALASAVTTRQDLEKAVEMHTLGRAELMGRYERKRRQ
jgi:Raf kinase inhibitor-like YbhB/YbcL family protein